MQLFNVNSDFRLLNKYSMDNLDVLTLTNQKGQTTTMLRSIGLIERFINWIFSKDQERLKRLGDYVKVISEHDFSFGSEVAPIEFYSKFFQWKKINFSPLIEKVRKDLLEPQIKTALKMNVFVNPKREEWEKRRLEVDLATQLGIRPIFAGSGVNGAKFGLGLDRRKLLVIKENGKDLRPRWKTERIIGQRTQPEVLQNDPRMAGAIAYMADVHFGFGLIPATFTTDQGISLQLFVEGSESADRLEFGKIFRGMKKKIREMEFGEITENAREKLQIRAVLNYFLGDLDGKDDKLRLKRNESSFEFYETDNDNTFPAEELNKKDDSQTLKKTYAWRRHKWAAKCHLNQGNTPQLEQIMQKLLNEDELLSFLNQVNAKYPGFFNQKRMNLLAQRLEILRNAWENKWSVAMLGEMYNLKQFLSIKGKLPTLDFKMIENYFSSSVEKPSSSQIQVIGKMLSIIESENSSFSSDETPHETPKEMWKRAKEILQSQLNTQ